MSIQKERILQLRGDALRDRDGDTIGTVEEIYFDADTGAPEWALVSTGPFGTKRAFVPVREATGTLRVPFDKATVKAAPKLDPDGQLSPSEEAELYRHYGMEYAGSGSDGRQSEGRDVNGRETGRVRLRKHVVTESVTRTSPDGGIAR
jgi:sporulation protein YlmC with PRC-barrel domain